ncbi:hypothetical protein [[Ruminococcus] lactaris]
MICYGQAVGDEIPEKVTGLLKIADPKSRSIIGREENGRNGCKFY